VEKIGERLRSTRELKKLTIKDIAKETNISSRYLEAIEDEEFDKIPGETYVLGFLRTYAEFLKLDGDEIVQGYKGYKIGESATPLEELTKPTGPFVLSSVQNVFTQYKKAFYIAGGVLGILIIIWLLSSIFSSDIKIKEQDTTDDIKKEFSTNKNSSDNDNIKNLALSDDRANVLVYKNETVQFLVDNKEVVFLLKDIKENSVVVELMPGNLIETIEIEKPKTIQVKDTQREITLTLKALTENRAKIFVMLGKKSGPESPEVQKPVVVEEPSGTQLIAQDRKNLKIIFEAEFLNKTYLDLYLDGMHKKNGMMPAGVKERWEASEVIQLRIGNAGGLKATINGKIYSFGLSGQVANKIVTWQKDLKNPNMYFIVVKDW
jgi:cytoskeletal protein RodZ